VPDYGTITLGAALTTLGTIESVGTAAFAGAYNVTMGTLIVYSGTLTLVSGQTYTATGGIRTNLNIDTLGGMTIKSSVASSPAYLNYTGTGANNYCTRTTMTDIDCTGSTGGMLMVHNAGTLTRCVNVVSYNEDSFTDPGAANVKTGSDYTYRGVAQTASYPTTATTQAADQATLEAQKAFLQRPADGGPAQIQFGASTPTVGTLNTAALETAAAAAQLVTDKAAVTAGQADILETRTILTITGTLPQAKVVEDRGGTLLKRSIVKTPNGLAAGGDRSCWIGVEAG
jgi:hypothetical protein